MARTLSLRIIAEGVETEAQRDYLNRQNIHLLQGYYFWKPMPYVALVMLLLSKPKARIIEEVGVVKSPAMRRAMYPSALWE